LNGPHRAANVLFRVARDSGSTGSKKEREVTMLEQLGLTAPAPLSISTLFVNLTLGAALSFVLVWHFRRFARTYASRAELANVLPVIVLATVLIISVVKSSLALSLGLVGALSIVRFRTPIKEPEELGYLFLAIAVGLGFGSDQRLATLVGLSTILAFLTLRRWTGSTNEAKHNLFLDLEVPDTPDGDLLSRVQDVLEEHTSLADRRRLDLRDGRIYATYLLQCESHERVSALARQLGQLPDAALSLIEEENLPAR